MDKTCPLNMIGNSSGQTLVCAKERMSVVVNVAADNDNDCLSSYASMFDEITVRGVMKMIYISCTNSTTDSKTRTRMKGVDKIWH